MYVKTIFLALLVALVTVSCDRQPETLVEVYDQAAMDAAIEKARGSVDQFVRVFEKQDGESFAVKAPISDGEDTEHFWIVDISYAEGKFTGTIGNEPGIVGNVSEGDSWTIAEDDISDFMFIRDELMYGNYTMRAMFSTMPEEEVTMWKSMLADEDAF